MSTEQRYEVLSPEGRPTVKAVKPTFGLPSLNNAVLAQIWDYMFRGDVVFSHIRNELSARFPGVRFVPYETFGNIHGPEQDELTALIPERLAINSCNAAIVGIGACGSCTPAVVRASVASESAGVPAVAIVATGFIPQARITARALGVDNLRIVEYPGVPMTQDPEKIGPKVATELIDPLIGALLEGAS